MDNRIRTTYIKVCEGCGKEYTRGEKEQLCRFTERTHCTKSCKLAGKLAPYEVVHCVTCGDAIARPKGLSIATYSARQYCSNLCASRGHSMKAAARLDAKVDAYAARFPSRTEKMQANAPWPLTILRKQVRRLWNPMRHNYYVAEVGVLR